MKWNRKGHGAFSAVTAGALVLGLTACDQIQSLWKSEDKTNPATRNTIAAATAAMAQAIRCFGTTSALQFRRTWQTARRSASASVRRMPSRCAWKCASPSDRPFDLLALDVVSSHVDFVGLLFIVWGSLTALIGFSMLSLGIGAVAILESASRTGGVQFAAGLTAAR